MRYPLLAVATAVLLSIPAVASAQQSAPAKLEVGAWTGTVTPPDGMTTSVTYDVAYAGDTLRITIRAGEHGTFDTSDVKLEADKLSFSFRPGPLVKCVLTRKEAGFAGTCTDEEGGIANMDLSPPKKEPAKS